MMQQSTASIPTQTYEIRVYEHLENDLAEWFRPVTVDYAANGETTLTVAVRDQTELHGLIIKIRDLNLTLRAIVNI